MTTKNLRLSARIAIILILLGSVFFGFQASNLGFSYDFENFFPDGDPDTKFYKEHRERFGSDNDIVLVGIEKEGSIFQEKFLKKVDSLADTLRQLNHVEHLRAPTDLNFFVQDPVMGGTFERSYLRVDKPSHYKKDSTRIYQSEELIGTFFSKDARSLCMVLHNEDQLAKRPSDSLARQIHSTISAFDFKESHVAGRIIGQQRYIELMKWEFAFFLSLAFVLVLLFLTFIFRSWWGVVIPLVVVLLSILWILGIMGNLREPINLLLTILPTILFVVGISDVVHLLSKYQEELQWGYEKHKALWRAFREIGIATFLTSLTTAAGFLTLLTARIAPIRDFGAYTALGVFIAFMMAFVLLPATLILIKEPKVQRTTLAHPIWNRTLRAAFSKVMFNPRWVLALSGIVIGFSLMGIERMELDKKILEDLEKDDPVQQDFHFFDEKFGGIRPFEMAIEVKGEDRTALDYAVIQDLDTIHDHLREHYQVGSIISPITLFSNANMAIKGGDPEANHIPEKASQHRDIRKKLESFQNDERMRSLITEDLKQTRITGRMPDLGSKRVRELSDTLHQFIAHNTDTSLFDYKLTGAANLIDKNNSLLSGNMMEGLMIAFVVITLIVVILFRSMKMIVAILIPNMLPLLMIGGIMGWAGIPLKVATSVIFTIAFGIAVDDTIHFTNRLKMELDKGKNLLYAIKRTYISTGRAILLTTLILCCGFISLIGSSFIGAYNIGLLITFTLFFAVLADLTLLPVLLILLFKRNELNPKRAAKKK